MTGDTGRAPQDALLRLVRAIADGEDSLVSALLGESPALATARVIGGATRHGARAFYLEAIGHYLYADETALHVAAAGYRAGIARTLIQMGANVRARNRLGAEPLHYAVIGMPGSRAWNPAAQAATVAYLIAAGADPNATDKQAVTPLHRAVRTRCAAAVQALLERGADVRCKNKNGSTPIDLVSRTTGRGGSGSPQAKAQQVEIVRLLQQHDVPL
jgi:Ankyrin repeats (many copies)/Ankyrin repeat